jgi:hypothetical protein
MHPDPHTRQALARGRQADLLQEAARTRQAHPPGAATARRRPLFLAALAAVVGRRRAEPATPPHTTPAETAST